MRWTTETALDVLVVDDDAVSRRVAERMLERLGHRPHPATGGAEALAALAARQYDLVLMDCRMPVLDGYEATRRARASEDGRRTPVVAMTAAAMTGEERQAYAAGMDGYLRKPFRMEELRAVVDRWAPSVSGRTLAGAGAAR